MPSFQVMPDVSLIMSCMWMYGFVAPLMQKSWKPFARGWVAFSGGTNWIWPSWCSPSLALCWKRWSQEWFLSIQPSSESCECSELPEVSQIRSGQREKGHNVCFSPVISVEASEDGKGHPSSPGHRGSGSASSWKPWSSLLLALLHLCCSWSGTVWSAGWVSHSRHPYGHLFNSISYFFNDMYESRMHWVESVRGIEQARPLPGLWHCLPHSIQSGNRWQLEWNHEGLSIMMRSAPGFSSNPILPNTSCISSSLQSRTPWETTATLRTIASAIAACLQSLLPSSLWCLYWWLSSFWWTWWLLS